MDTPICDFVRRYAESGTLRLHMPGHKGAGPLGFESLDLTEIDGADNLYAPDGIIARSEENASVLFGCPTFYSAEGASLCIRAMLQLCLLYARQQGKKPLIAAGRNAHKVFVTAAALLDLDVIWLHPGKEDSYLSYGLTPGELERQLGQMEETPAAVYLTSPDYLGNTVDIAALAPVCHRHGCLLLVDNAHGAYLRFLPESRYPIDLGADMCCDSAHKTLPVLTGGAYLHISPAAPALFSTHVKHAMALFGSTSPSYLILQSLDAANGYLADGYPILLAAFIREISGCRDILAAHGYELLGDEPLKITLRPKAYGYDGRDFAGLLRKKNIVCEFYDPDYVVLMLTPETGTEGLKRLKEALLSIPKKPAITAQPPKLSPPRQVESLRQAALSPSEIIPVSESVGRILSSPSVGCPPAVPIVVCGERIDEAALRCFQYYGIQECAVIIDE